MNVLVLCFLAVIAVVAATAEYNEERIMQAIKELQASSLRDTQTIQELRASSQRDTQKIQALEASSQALEASSMEDKRTIMELKNRLQILEKMTAIDAQLSQTGVVAFHARIAEFTGSPTEHTAIPFDDVILNVGDAYNPQMGDFTAPVNGLYLFGFNLQASGDCGTDNIGVMLVRNGVVMSTSFSECYASAAGAVTLQLAAGDRVWLETNYYSSCRILYYVSTSNNFSGHLLYQII